MAAGLHERYTLLDEEKEELVEQDNNQAKLGEKANKSANTKRRVHLNIRLDDLLDSLKLKRAAYHSRALIGSDFKTEE